MYELTKERDALCTVLAQTVLERYRLLTPKAKEGVVYLLARKVALEKSPLVLEEWVEKLRKAMEA